MFKEIKKTQTGFFPQHVEFTRLVQRTVYDKKAQPTISYTVATKNNCIQANYDDLDQAIAHYDRLINS